MEQRKDRHKVNPSCADTKKDKSASTDLSKDKVANAGQQQEKPAVKPIIGTDYHRK